MLYTGTDCATSELSAPLTVLTMADVDSDGGWFDLKRVFLSSLRACRRSYANCSSAGGEIWVDKHFVCYFLVSRTAQLVSERLLHSGHRRQQPTPMFSQPASTDCTALSAITFGYRAFSVAGPMVWNSLPTEFRDLSVGFGVFRRTVKTILFARYCCIQRNRDVSMILRCINFRYLSIYLSKASLFRWWKSWRIRSMNVSLLFAK